MHEKWVLKEGFLGQAGEVQLQRCAHTKCQERKPPFPLPDCRTLGTADRGEVESKCCWGEGVQAKGKSETEEKLSR